MKTQNDPIVHRGISTLTEAQMRRSTYVTVLLATLLPPFVGGSLMGLVGFYPMPEFYLIFASYSGPYVFAVVAGCLTLVPRAFRYIVGLTQMDPALAQASAQRIFGRLPWMLFGGVSIYSVGGALSADFALEDLGIRDYSLRDHLYHQFGLIPVVMITVFPVFFFFVDRLGRYLAPRGVSVIAIPLWMKLLMIGIVTPLLIDSLLIGYYLNRTGHFQWDTLALWLSLIALAAGGTWMAWRSLRQALAPLTAFITSQSAPVSGRSGASLAPLSLDEIGVLTARYAQLLTAREALTQSLQRAESMANAVLDHAGALVVVLDRDGRIVRFNRASEQLSGYTFAEVKGMCPWEMLLPPEEADTIRRDAFEALARNPQVMAGRYVNDWVSKSGGRHLIEWFNTPLLDADGKTEFMVSIGLDITERNRTQEQLLLKDAAIEHALNAVAMADPEGRISYVNSAFLKMWGYDSAKQVLGHMATELWSRPEKAEAAIGVVRQNGSWTGTLEARRADDRTFPAETYSALIRDAGGRPVQMIGLFLDITERKRTEAAARQSEERLIEAQRLAKVGNWELDLVEGRLLWSDEIFRLFEMDKVRFGASYEAFLNSIHPDDRERVNKAYTDSLANRSPYEIEHRLRMADGRIKWVRERCESFFDAQGKPIRSVGTVQDITIQHRAGEQLRESEERLRLALRASRQGLYDLNVQTGEATVNAEYALMLGYDPAEFHETNAAWIERLHPDDRQSVSAAYRDYVSGKLPEYRVEFRQRMKSGQWKWILSLGELIERDGKGQPLRMIGTHTDISDIKLAEAELKTLNEKLEQLVDERTAALAEREQQLRRAQEIARLGHWTSNVQTGELAWSDEIFRIFGREPQSFVPSESRFFEAVHPDEVERVRQVVAEAFQRGEIYRIDHRIVRPDGQIRWVHEEALTEYDAEGRPLRLTGTVQDITERKLVEEALRASRDEAERASRAKSEFLSHVSHELRTPLNAILGFGQLLELDEASLSPDQRDSVQQILQGGRHLLTLISELLDLGRIEAGRLNLSLEAVSIDLLLDECVRMVQPAADDAGVDIRFRPGDPHRFANADRVRLTEVFLNLLSNAVKYNRRGGWVDITCKPDERGLVVCVRDSGAGISPEDMRQLFDPFTRASRLVGRQDSSGLGLSITRKLVELMGGGIRVESTVGEGSAFYVTLQRSTRDAVSLGNLPVQGGQSAGAEPVGGIVLYVDDDEGSCALMRAVLRDTPYRILTAGSGEEAMDLLQRGLDVPPVLILLDINLPGISGFDVLLRLRMIPALDHVPVMAMSASASQQQVVRARDAGFSRFVEKPVMWEAVEEVLPGIRSRFPSRSGGS